MGNMATLQPVPPAAVTRVLATFDRDQLAGFIAVAIDLLDLADGDLDIEPNGDEQDGSMGEDDFTFHNQGIWALPGCPVSDPGEEDDPSGQRDEDEYNTGGHPGTWYEDCDLEPPRVPPQWPVSPAND